MVVEQVLVERFHWNLFELDRTDIESLFPFFFYLADQAARGGRKTQAPTQHVYCDQASWI